MRMARYLISSVALACLVGVLTPQAAAEIQQVEVAYEHDGGALQGTLGVDDAIEKPKGAVLVVHEWWGLNDYAKQRATMLAELGYVAFAVDMYGPGKATEDPNQAKQWATPFYVDRDLARGRVLAGLAAFRKSAKLGDDASIAAIGYCFGGTVVTELAYTGTPGVLGIVSFHGNPFPPKEDDTINAKLLFAHGDADPLVKPEDLDKVTSALDEKQADWMLISYSGALHAFSNPKADTYGLPPVAYDEKADRRSWQHMLTFFDELFVVAE